MAWTRIKLPPAKAQGAGAMAPLPYAFGGDDLPLAPRPLLILPGRVEEDRYDERSWP